MMNRDGRRVFDRVPPSSRSWSFERDIYRCKSKVASGDILENRSYSFTCYLSWYNLIASAEWIATYCLSACIYKGGSCLNLSSIALKIIV